MSYGLLWIEMLVSGLLWMALMAACMARIKRRWMRVVLMSLGSALPMLLFAMLVFEWIVFRFWAKVENTWLAYAAPVFVAAAVGLVVIWRMARPCQAGMAPSAVSWRRGSLAAAWLASVAIAVMTLWNMDLAIRARANVLAVEADALWLATGQAVPSDEQNAALLYEKAFARLHADQPTDVNSSPLGNSDTFDPKESAMLAYLAREAPMLALLRQAAALPGCRFDEDLATPDMERLLPELNEERGASNILGLDARHELAEGHVSKAIADVDAIFKMSRHMGQRPALVSGLVAIGIDAQAVHFLQEALPAVRQREDIAGLNLQSLSSLRRIFWHTLQGEERLGLALLGGQDELGRAGIGNKPAWALQQVFGNDLLPRVFLLPDELDAYVQLMDEFKQVTREPYFKAKDQLSEMGDSYSPSRLHKGLLVSLIVSSMTRSFHTLADIEASDVCAQVAVAATRYRLDHGKLPDHLGDLVPAYLDAVPLDPFDGQPLRLIVKDDQWIVYSIEARGKSEGGQAVADLAKGYGVFALKANAATTRP